MRIISPVAFSPRPGSRLPSPALEPVPQGGSWPVLSLPVALSDAMQPTSTDGSHSLARLVRAIFLCCRIRTGFGINGFVPDDSVVDKRGSPPGRSPWEAGIVCQRIRAADAPAGARRERRYRCRSGSAGRLDSGARAASSGARVGLRQVSYECHNLRLTLKTPIGAGREAPVMRMRQKGEFCANEFH